MTCSITSALVSIALSLASADTNLQVKSSGLKYVSTSKIIGSSPLKMGNFPTWKELGTLESTTWAIKTLLSPLVLVVLLLDLFVDFRGKITKLGYKLHGDTSVLEVCSVHFDEL